MFGVLRGIYRGASRAPITGKRGHNFYKGKGSGKMGDHTDDGRFIINWDKVRNFKVPDSFEGFTLQPYVTRGPGDSKLRTGKFTKDGYINPATDTP